MNKKAFYDQDIYMGRWVDREHFRAYVYNATDKKLANSWDEYKDLIATGLWFDEKPVVAEKTKRKLTDGSNS